MINKKNRSVTVELSLTGAAVLFAVALALNTRASESEFSVPSWSGEPNTEYAEWLNFTTAFGESGNSPDVAGSTGDAVLTQTVPGAIITGGMNIYNPAGASAFAVADAVDAPVQTVVFQSRTSGTELDYAGVVLEYGDAGETLTATREEVGREAGGQGDTVISKWTWNLGAVNVRSFTIRANAAGPHASLVAARVDLRMRPRESGGPIQILKNSPDLDRWNYPFNATPGTRVAAPIFRETSDEGIDRHGIYIIGFNTSDEVAPGLSPSAYVVEAARLIATTTSHFEVPYDPTNDSVFTYLSADDPSSVPDEDEGRPIEVFGAGFRNEFDAMTWEETTVYSPEEGERTVFPATVNESGHIVDVTQAVNYSSPIEIRPFAIGSLEDTAPGQLIPENTAMIFDLNVGDPAVQDYLGQALSLGRAFFSITSLSEGARDATQRPYPEFATRDSLLGDPPVLEMVVRIVSESAAEIRIVSIRLENGHPTFRFSGQKDRNYEIRYTSNFAEWETIDGPTLNYPESGIVEWADPFPSVPNRFYQVITVE